MLVAMTSALEAILFAAGSDGLTITEIAEVLQLSVDESKSLCEDLRRQYDDRDAGICLVELAESWQLVTRREYATYLRRMATAPMSTSLSTAALEVLAIIAYQQPISRPDIESVRGVQSDRAISTLLHRQMVRDVGRQDSPGRPILYGTTDTFLQVFGLRSLTDLPPLPVTTEVPQDLSLFDLTPSLPRD